MAHTLTTTAGAAMPVIEPRGQTYASVTDRVLAPPLRPPGWGWLAGFGIACALTLLLGVAVSAVLIFGVGVWGINVPVAWAFAITNFVWWIGIGHAGTLISAILLLMRQGWRDSINRFAEAMTLFAVLNAGLMPLLHLGRIGRFYWLFPYPNTMDLWPQWRSPLVFDVFAVSTYATVSLLFWYVGLLPDLAAMRDTATRRWQRVAAGVFALGWRGSARHWHRHQTCYLLLAGLATPLVVSVHSIVSFDFAVAIVPGWHSTIFPPYFVAGAIFSGFAMVITIAVPLRAAYGWQDLITTRHLNNMAIVMLVSGLVVGYGYVMEFFTAYYSGDGFERYMAINRVIGAYWPAFVLMMLGNVLAPQALWFRRVRTSPWTLFGLSLVINVGMWCERFVIIVQSLHRDYMPSAWHIFHGTFWDWALLAGTLGFFAFMMLLFVKLAPAIPISEVRRLLHEHPPGPRGAPVSAGPALEAAQRSEDAPDPSPAHAGPPPRDEALYGLVAEFDTPEALLSAARTVRDKGYQRVEAYTPFPVKHLAQTLGMRRTGMAGCVLAGALLGAIGGYFMQWYFAVIDYPWNIGGRPLHSWPSFIPLTFELAVLSGSLFGFVGMLALNRLPQPYHPVMNTPGFRRAMRDRFLLAIEKRDARFDRGATRGVLESTSPLRVWEVER